MPHPYSRNLVSRTMNLKSSRNFTNQYNNTQVLAARLTVVTKVKKIFLTDYILYEVPSKFKDPGKKNHEFHNICSVEISYLGTIMSSVYFHGTLVLETYCMIFIDSLMISFLIFFFNICPRSCSQKSNILFRMINVYAHGNLSIYFDGLTIGPSTNRAIRAFV